MSPSESSMPLIAFTHARLQDNAYAMSHDSYLSSRKSTRKSIEITKSAEKSRNQREIRKSDGKSGNQ